MKFLENSIFTKTGRLMRKIEKTEKFLAFFSDLEKSIDSLIETCDKKLEELKLSEQEETKNTESKCECDVDSNKDNSEDSEFDFINRFDEAIKNAKNTVDESDDEDDECEDCDLECGDHCINCTSNKENYEEDYSTQPNKKVNKTESDDIISKYEEEFGDDTPRVQKIVHTKRSSEIRSKTIPGKKVTINKNVQKISLKEEHVKTAIKVMIEDNVDLDATLKLLKEEGIELIDEKDGTYVNDDGSIALSVGLTSDDIIDRAIFKFNLPYPPHGPQNLFFNKVLNELNIKKIDPKWKNIGIGGMSSMCQIDDEIIAVNCAISGNVLYITFIYNVYKG